MPITATDELRELYDRFAGRIFTLAHYTLGSRSAAEDAVQTVFLRASQNLARFRGQAALGTWLWRIALNHVSDELRRRKRVEEVPLDAILGWGDPGQSPETRHGLKQLDEVPPRAAAGPTRASRRKRPAATGSSTRSSRARCSSSRRTSAPSSRCATSTRCRTTRSPRCWGARSAPSRRGSLARWPCSKRFSVPSSGDEHALSSIPAAPPLP